jgi:hypothetical protein
MNPVSQTSGQKAGESWPAPLRTAAHLVSYLFHPIFLVPLMGAYLMYEVPSFYVGVPPALKVREFVALAINTVFFPLLAVLLSRALGFVKSLHMEDPRDRIIPYIVTLTCYFWAWRVMHHLPESPASMTAMVFGVFLTTSAGLVLNSFVKISMHAMGVGGLVMFCLLLGWQGMEGAGIAITLSIFIAGLVYSARAVVSDHTTQEMLLGLFVGMLGQLAGLLFFH